MANRVEVPLTEVNAIARKALAGFGLSEAHQTIIVDVLLYAELRNKTQGLVKIVEKTVQPAADAQPMSVTRHSPAVAHVRGRGEVGMIVLREAATIAVDIARELGVGAVGTSNTSTSTGSIGYYARHIADAGMIGIVMAGSPKVMAVAQSVDPVMGTNPIAIAVPADPEPVVLDIATSAMTWFGLIEAARDNQEIAPDLAFDRDGTPTTDPAAAMAGALKAFAGIKGSGLALIVELLTGPLVGASIVGDDEDNRGNLVLALNPDAFGDGAGFRERVPRLLSRIRSGRRRDANEPIVFPGEHGAAMASAQLTRGSLFVDATIWQRLVAMAGS